MKIKFKRSKEIGKIPSVDNLDYGEIAINYSSGEGNAFFSTKKADNTIAMFSDNAHWDKKINKINVMANEYPKPERIIIIDFYTEEEIPTKKDEDNPILAHGNVKLNINGYLIEKFATIEVQGKSSATKPKKNFTFAFYNDAEYTDSYKFRLAGMVAHSEYVYKANYIDATHSRNIACNRLWEQIIYAHENPPYRGNEGVLTIDNGTLCHVDGYPCVVNINDEFYGIGDFNIGKKRDNYNLSSKNQNHIQLQAEPRASFETYVASQWEIRNPKSPDASFETKLNLWFNDNAKSDEAFKTDFPVHHNVQNAIDYFLFAEFCYLDDILDNNVQLTTWDGNEYFMLPYDLDTCFGLKWDGTRVYDADTMGTVVDTTLGGSVSTGLTSKSFWTKFANAYHEEISEQYNNLKNLGIFSIKNIAKIFSELERPFGSYYDKEYAKWTNSPSKGITSYGQVIEWVKKRIEWMDSMYGVVLPTGITIDGPDSVVDEGTFVAVYSPVSSTATSTKWSIVGGNQYATIDQGGKVTVLYEEEHSVIIRATSIAVPSLYADKTVTVSQYVVPPTSITILGTGSVKNKAQFTVSFIPNDCNRTDIAWSIVEETSLAAIDSNGILTVSESTISAETITIRATSKYNTDIYADKSISIIYEPVYPQTIEIVGDEAVSGTCQYSVVITPSDATHTAVTWSIVSGNENNVASIDKDTGLLTVESGLSESYEIVIRATSVVQQTIFGDKTITVGNLRPYLVLFEADNLAGTEDQIIDTGVKLFSDELTQWTLFSYIKNNSNPQTYVYNTLFACVNELSSPYAGIRCDSWKSGSETGNTPSVVLISLNTTSNKQYIDSTNGLLKTATVLSTNPTDPLADKYPVLVSRDGDTYTYSLDGINWVPYSSITTSITDTALKAKSLIIGGELMGNGSYSRFIKTDSPVCVAVISGSQYDFTDLVDKYTPDSLKGTNPFEQHAQSVTVTPSAITMYVGSTYTPTISILPENAVDKTYTVSFTEPDICSESNGTITALNTGTTTMVVTLNDGGLSASMSISAVAKLTGEETYDYKFEADTLSGDDTSGEDPNIQLFNSGNTNWTMFTYYVSSINKAPNSDSGSTTPESYTTFMQCVESKNPYAGIRVETPSTGDGVIGTECPLRMKIILGSTTDTYVNNVTGTIGTGNESLTLARKPIMISRNSNVFEYSTDGLNWSQFEMNSTTLEYQLSRLQNTPLTIGFDYVRNGDTVTDVRYRHLKTEKPVCFALKYESNYPFQTLCEKYTPNS